ncbi:FAD binding domain-containing [Fusarium albosuccineum]|uniref:FAD binding domain-containing n=1 Tax=Fusarium albosuccineum TaxID=1237068 RepID=A0A8H4NZN8_9HYPO|nr:FAD binding domain-containing [Fusarium albosuccineum]
MSGPGDRLYWFLFCAMPRMAYGKDIPRWSKEDETKLAVQHASDRITDGVTFADVYNNRQVSTLVSLEEHVFSRWHFGRFITIGDSAHKVHPITAQGGNGAMESAVALVNALSSRLQNTQNLSPDDIEAVFSEVQSRRFRRAEDIVKEGEMIQSIVNQQYPFSALMIKYLVPVFGDRLFFDGWLKNSVGGLRVEGLPFPQRSKNKAFKDELMTTNSDGRYWKFWSITIGLGSLLAS